MRTGSAKTGGGSKFGAVSGARQLATLVRGMSIEAIEDSIRQPPLILFVSSDPEATDIAGNLTGVRGTPSVQTASMANLPRDLEQFDVIVVHNPASNDDFVRLRSQAGRSSHLIFDTGPHVNGDSFDDLRDRIAVGVGNGAVALGRWYPAFRAAASSAVISDTSRINAQFAMVANIPAMVPVVGNFVAASADMLVLTKNQLTMAIKIAAIYGKPLGNRMDVIRDLTPVIGGGFIWRTLAREGAALMPLASGTIPKVAIAYSGTFATGKAVDAYYRLGKQPSKDQVVGFYRSAMTKVQAKFRPKAIPATVDPVTIPQD